MRIEGNARFNALTVLCVLFTGALFLRSEPAQAQMMTQAYESSPILKHRHAGADQPLYRRLLQTVKSPQFSLTLLGRAQADFQFDDRADGNNGFLLDALWLGAHGELDFGFGYLVRADLTRQPALLDMQLSYRPVPNVRFNAGLYKAPFSYEFLQYLGAIDFIQRSQAVNALAPRRQVGVGLDAWTTDRLLNLSLGVFNGNGAQLSGNNNNRFMYVGRLAIAPRIATAPGDLLVIGANAAYNDIAGGGLTDQVTFGADVRIEFAPILISAEAIQRNTRFMNGSTISDFGYQATAGVWITGDHQLLVRWDSFLPDDPAFDSNLLILGSNFWPTSPFKLQANYVIPPDTPEFENHRVLLNFQLNL